MTLSEELQARGFINQFSGESLALIFDQEKRVVYQGIDPSADSAHAGNFVIWMLLKHLIKDGHQVVFLVGGGTGLIGDPKPDMERVLSTEVEIQTRVLKLQKQAKKFFGEDKVSFVNNHTWLGSLSLIAFLRDIGKHFTVNELLKKEAIAKRVAGETGISYTEFAYPLLQAYDYLQLYKDQGCTLQVGGSDQWGNIVSGVDLIRRVEKTTVFAVTVPLIIDKVSGKKFGKSEGNAVWLDPEKTSPYKFYQFWLQTADESVVEYLKLFTTLPLFEIASLAEEVNKNPQARLAQKALAREVTVLVHGEEVYEKVNQVTEYLFGEGDITDLSSDVVSLLKNYAPLVFVNDRVLLVDTLVTAELAVSKREARTFIESGAVWINGVKITNCDYQLTKDTDGTILRLKRGKKHSALISIS